jgi:Domain of unknown function (DUF4394)/Calx-beta domain
MRRVMVGAAMVAALVAAPPPASGSEAAVGITSGAPELVRFDTAAPGTIVARVPLPLITGEQVLAADVRTATGELYAFTSLNRLLIVDVATGATQSAGAAISTAVFTGNLEGGFDDNPTVDRLRLVNASDHNLRFNTFTELPVDSDNDSSNGITRDTSLAFDAGDPNNGDDPQVAAAAYDRADSNPATSTTLFTIENGDDVLATIGGVNGTPSPNGGLMFTVGALGVDFQPTSSLDVATPAAGGSDTLYATTVLSGATQSTLYRINPATGAATALGAVGGRSLRAFAVLPGGALRVVAPATAVSEAGASAVIDVARSGDSRAPLRVAYRTVERTAVAGSDYVATAGVLELAAGQTSGQIVVPMLQDTEADGTETFAIEFGRAVGGAVDTPVHTVRIADDEPAPGGAPAADTVPPVLLLARALAAARRLRVGFACSEACRARLVLRLEGRSLGSGNGRLARAGTGRATIRLSRAGRRELQRQARRRGRLRLTLASSVSDVAGNRVTGSSRFRLARR